MTRPEILMDTHQITSLDALRSVIGEPSPVVESKVFDHVDPYAATFIKQAPLVFVATSDEEGRLDVSPKGDPAGFVAVEDPQTLLIPERKGNKLTYGFRNILQTGRIGLIFVVPGARETLRVNGTATLSKDPALLQRLSAENKPALLCTRVAVEESFFHCGKAMIRSAVWQQASWPTDFDASIARQLGRKFKMSSEETLALNASLEANYRDELY